MYKLAFKVVLLQLRKSLYMKLTNIYHIFLKQNFFFFYDFKPIGWQHSVEILGFGHSVKKHWLNKFRSVTK